MAWRFPVWIFSAVLSKSICISALRSSSNSLVILFIHSAFPLCSFGCHIFFKIVRFLLNPVVGMFSRHLQPVIGRIFFRCFGMSCFVCIVLAFVDISLIFFLSPVLSGSFPQIVLLFWLVLHFPFCSNIFQRLFVWWFWPVFVDFLSAFPVEFPILVLIFSSCFLRGSQCSHKLISPLHRLVLLIRLYHSLICEVILDLFYLFLS